MADDDHPVQRGHAAELRGKPAECDGGGPLWGTRYAGRQEFTGTLTGDFVDHGDPPWRWYLLKQLVRKPENYLEDAVWCEADSIFLLDDPTKLLGPGAEQRVAARKAVVEKVAAQRAAARAAKTASRASRRS